MDDNTVIQLVTSEESLDVITFDDEHRDDISDFCDVFEVGRSEEQGLNWMMLNAEIIQEAIMEYINLNQMSEQLTLQPISALQGWLSERLGQLICVKFKD